MVPALLAEDEVVRRERMNVHPGALTGLPGDVRPGATSLVTCSGQRHSFAGGGWTLLVVDEHDGISAPSDLL